MTQPQKTVAPQVRDYQVRYFSDLAKLPVCVDSPKNRIGRVHDLVFKVSEPYPEALGIFMSYGRGKPTQFVPWDKVLRVEEDAIFVQPPPAGGVYPPFVDQPGLIMVDDDLMGRTILATDGRTIEVVNDVHLILSRKRMLLIHVDTSLNGFWRTWGLSRLVRGREKLISWKYVQPLSVEDAAATDNVSLSITRKQLKELPSEDLADVLEELTGQQQQALFSALDSSIAAEALIEAEPRTQRQIIADLRQERARTILLQMSPPQVADLFAVLPHDESAKLLELLPDTEQQKIKALLSNRQATARTLMSAQFMTTSRDASVAQVLATIRASKLPPTAIAYVYVLSHDTQKLQGVVDALDLLLAPDTATMAQVMVAPVISAQEADTRDELAEIFSRYHYRMIPVVNPLAQLVGVVQFTDIIKGPGARA